MTQIVTPRLPILSHISLMVCMVTSTLQRTNDIANNSLPPSHQPISKISGLPHTLFFVLIYSLILFITYLSMSTLLIGDSSIVFLKHFYPHTLSFFPKSTLFIKGYDAKTLYSCHNIVSEIRDFIIAHNVKHFIMILFA